MELFYAGCYTRPEKMTQELKHFFICLISGGFDFMHFYSGDRKRIFPGEDIVSTGAYLFLVPPGTTLKFSAGKGRENWGAMLDIPEMEFRSDSLQCSINGVSLHTVIKLTNFQLCRLRETFASAVENIFCAHPAGREKATLQIYSLLAELIPDPSSRSGRHPFVEEMKKMIEEDLHFKYSIKELNDRLGKCSLPYMRKLFFAEYGIMPGKYRNGLRLNRILTLLAQSDLSLKMIADEVGMKHLPHLYAFLRTQQHASPKELLAQIRGDKH